MKLCVLIWVCLLAAKGVCDDIFKTIEERDLAAFSLMTNDIEIVNGRNALGLTPLMVAARQGDVVMVEMLIAAGADIDAADKGFTVKDQVENYLSRTSNARTSTEDMLRRLGVDQSLIQSFKAEIAELNGTPERRKAWKTILRLVCTKRSTRNGDAERRGDSELIAFAEAKCGGLEMSDLMRLFSSLKASSEGVELSLKGNDNPYLAVFNNRSVRNVNGGESLFVFTGESLKLTNKADLIMLTGGAHSKLETDFLWSFAVRYVFLQADGEVIVKQGHLSARMTGQGKPEIFVGCE